MLGLLFGTIHPLSIFRSLNEPKKNEWLIPWACFFCEVSTQKTESNKTLVQGYDIIVLLYIAIQVE